MLKDMRQKQSGCGDLHPGMGTVSSPGNSLLPACPLPALPHGIANTRRLREMGSLQPLCV